MIQNFIWAVNLQVFASKIELFLMDFSPKFLYHFSMIIVFIDIKDYKPHKRTDPYKRLNETQNHSVKNHIQYANGF